MRLKLKSKKELVEGQCRNINKFLLFPKNLNDEYRWLERATIEQRVRSVPVGGSGDWTMENMWMDEKWIDSDKVKIEDTKRRTTTVRR